MAGYFEILCGIAAVIIGLYYYFTAKFEFWKERGIPGPKPIPVFGNAYGVILGKIALGVFLKNLYDEYRNEPMVGIFARRTPIMILNDPELIKDVLIKDFSKFADRGLTVHERTEPLSQHLFALESKRWRPLRTSLSPVFTSGRLKEMFSLILECSEHLEQYLEKLATRNEPIEFRDLTAKYTTDVIGNCAFGLEMNALSDEESAFRKMGNKIFKPDLDRLILFRIRQAMPWLYDLLGYVLPQTEWSLFFTGVIVDTINYRKKNNIVRHDFVNTLMELRDHPEKLGDIKVTDSLLTAQAFVFFAAGFETSSTTMSNALYELALNQDIQDKLRKEINTQFLQNEGELTYDIVKKLPYLDGVFRETLRKYPPAPVLMRQSTASYTFEGTKVTVPKNQKVWISVYGIHHDPAIYPKPEVFDPERFMGDAANSRHPMQYLPFGDGPRNCIGARFAVYQAKIGLMKILRNYKVDVCEKTMKSYETDSTSFLLSPKDGIYLNLLKVE